jgi:hypothetical protein
MVFPWKNAYFYGDFDKKGELIMGGYGSTRWLGHTKKTQVEECSKICMKDFKKYLYPGYFGTLRWYIGERETRSLGFRVVGVNMPNTIWLDYTITRWGGEKVELDYPIRLTSTPLPWGGVRHWFVCPLSLNGIACNRRVGCLYLPPGENYFGCRHCYDLTYRSSQEGVEFKSLYQMLAMQMQDEYPGINWKDVRAMLQDEWTPHLGRILAANYIRNWEPPPDPYEHYLTKEQLLEGSGLREAELCRLEDVRLLVPDTKDGRYRPKLVGWGKKLAYLLREGWTVDDIKRWSRERWKSGNPRKWPPFRGDYSS